jgi:hypothetical protein
LLLAAQFETWRYRCPPLTGNLSTPSTAFALELQHLRQQKPALQPFNFKPAAQQMPLADHQALQTRTSPGPIAHIAKELAHRQAMQQRRWLLRADARNRARDSR